MMMLITRAGLALLVAACGPALLNAQITVTYPAEGSVFPPDMAAPTFIWKDAAAGVTRWSVEVRFADGAPVVRAERSGERLKIGEIDPRCISDTNELPKLTPEEEASRAWKPATADWQLIKKHSVDAAAVVRVIGYRGDAEVSRGEVRIRTSRDPVAAPIFYRDVPLMPAKLEKGEIKPISPKLLPFIAWRMRDVSQPSSRVVMTGVHTCANCHSFSTDGKTLGLDLDGPHNDKGLYAVVPVGTQMSIRNEDVISWRKFRGEMAQDKRIGFMSQVSPDGRYVVTATQVEYYVANFKNYRFLQVFYPTRGILAWYDRTDGSMHSLPGADDPGYVQANPVWSPDGKYIVFIRARAGDSYPEGRPMAEYANDPNEVPIQYDIYRIPLNGGRGGTPEPIRGASGNGMSNSFPKVSPDGKWIVFVQSRNGQLMRPDGQLYVVPAEGGAARRMRCNTPLMNSWHSFSPNGRWMVFSSKSRSPYTQMFLTHIGEDGTDTPPILIEDATAANRAVNIPEFVNIPPDGIAHIDVPAAEFYRLYDLAYDLTEKGDLEPALAAWRNALAVDAQDANALSNYGALLLRKGQFDEASANFEKALVARPELVDARNNLGLLLLMKGRTAEAEAQFRKSLETSPKSTEAHFNLGNTFLMTGRFSEALAEWRAALEIEPKKIPVLTNIAWMLATCSDDSVRNGADAVKAAERARELAGRDEPMILDILGAAYAEAGRFTDAAKAAERAAGLAEQRGDAALAKELRGRAVLYAGGKAFRDVR